MTNSRWSALIKPPGDRPALTSLCLGGIACVGFAPLGWWPVTLACLAGWMALIHAAPTARAALWRGWLFGFAHFTIGNNWIAKAFTFQDEMPQALGLVAPMLLSLYFAIYPMLAGGAAWRLRRERPDISYACIFGAAWIATEYLRGTMLTGYPWNPLSEIWLPLPRLSAMLDLVGTYSMSGIAVLLAGGLIANRPPNVAPWKLGSPALGILTLLAFGSLSHFYAPYRAPEDPTAPRIRVVQPDLDQEQRPRDDYAETNLAKLASLSGTPGPAPRLIVWPEGALRFLPEDGYPPAYYWRAAPAVTRGRIAAVLGPNDVVLTGGNSVKFDAKGEVSSITNSIFAFDAKTRILGRYDKAHLVPFGEYLPAKPFLSALGLAQLVPGEFAPGAGPATLQLPGFGAVGMQICYEIIFSGIVVDPKHRPAFIFQPSNDSWYGYWGQAEHLAQARMRAIEEGLPVIRATPTGISAIIDAQGRVLASIPADTAGAIELPIPPATAPTLFSRVGNAMAFLVALILGMSAIAIRRFAR